MTQQSSQLHTRLPAELERRFAAICLEQGVSMSEAIRRLVSEYCDDPPVKIEIATDEKKYERVRNPEEIRASSSRVVRTGELYCGPGGLGVASSRAKLATRGKPFTFEHSWASDYDADTCQTYALNIKKHSPDVEVIHRDVHQLDIENLPPVEGLLYGFPCNDFSLVGETRGLDGTYGPLYRYGVDYLNEHNPLFVLAENVGGLSSANEGAAFSRIVDELETAGEHGYVLTKHLYKFEDYGVPQARHRIIMVGMRKDLGLRFEVPKPSGELRSCREAIESPPITATAFNNELTKQSKTVAERLSYIRPGENAWTADIPEHLQLNVTSARLSQIYKRLEPEKPAYTVTGSGGGGTHVYHWSENRALTNRERARLQTFPDDFQFHGSKESVRKQIGMAVPPDGGQVILEAILKTLFGKKYESVEPSMGYSTPRLL